MLSWSYNQALILKLMGWNDIVFSFSLSTITNSFAEKEKYQPSKLFCWLHEFEFFERMSDPFNKCFELFGCKLWLDLKSTLILSTDQTVKVSSNTTNMININQDVLLVQHCTSNTVFLSKEQQQCVFLLRYCIVIVWSIKIMLVQTYTKRTQSANAESTFRLWCWWQLFVQHS